MVTGGAIDLHASEQILVINPAEAKTVRHIFALYRELGCVRRVKDEADRLGLRRSVGRRREASSAAASRSRAGTSTGCSPTRFTPDKLPIGSPSPSPAQDFAGKWGGHPREALLAWNTARATHLPAWRKWPVGEACTLRLRDRRF